MNELHGSRWLAALALGACMALSSSASAQVPREMTVQGILYDMDGVPVEGATTFVFTLTRGGTMLWTETRPVTLVGGLFTIPIGSMTPIDPAFFATGRVSLVVSVDGDVMDPIPLTTVAYAMRAESAASADTYDGDLDWGQLTGVPAGFADGTDDGAGSYAAGDGLALTGTTFSAAFGGDGAATTVSRSDHTHAPPAWSTLTGIPADFADGLENPAWSSITGVPMGFADGIDNVGGAPAWSTITGIPAGFADGVDDGEVMLATVALTTAADYTFSGLDGELYRRFRIEVEGTVGVGGQNRVIAIRPNGATTNYGPGSMHWNGHQPGASYLDQSSQTGLGGSPLGANLLALCVTHFNVDGTVICTGTMNTRTGMFRMARSDDMFTSSGPCGSSSCLMSTEHINAWRDTTTPITSLVVTFTGATLFNGRVTLFGVR